MESLIILAALTLWVRFMCRRHPMRSHTGHVYGRTTRKGLR